MICVVFDDSGDDPVDQVFQLHLYLPRGGPHGGY